MAYIIHVSIHAPARGATIDRGIQCFEVAVSIHAPARGATDPEGHCQGPARFQSTRPRGARLRAIHIHHKRDLFQSTRPRGARPAFSEAMRRQRAVSIHAPARGATGYERKCS